MFIEEKATIDSFVDELGQKHGINQAALAQVKELLASKLSNDEFKPAEAKAIAKKLLESQIGNETQHED